MLPLVANGRACEQRQRPGGLMSMALLQNQNLGRLGNLALLHLSRCVDLCNAENIHGEIFLWLLPISVRPPTLLGRADGVARHINTVWPWR
jgi:hypothetical protein